jgi:hypothetical protein
VSLAKIHFYRVGHLDIRNRLITLFTLSPICHCTLEIDDTYLISHVDKERGVRMLRPSSYHAIVCKPYATYDVGHIDIATVPPLEDAYNISGFKFFMWHTLGRILGFPMPNSCATYISTILMKNNKLNNRIFYPHILYKEIKDAYNTTMRAS